MTVVSGFKLIQMLLRNISYNRDLKSKKQKIYVGLN